MPRRFPSQEFCPLWRAPSRCSASWAIPVPVTVTDTITVTDTDTDTDAGTVNRVREPDTDRDTATDTDRDTVTDTDIDTVSTLTMLGSGSAGNSALVATDHCKILVDGGLSARQVVLRLEQCGVTPEQLDGVLLTHEHGRQSVIPKVGWNINEVAEQAPPRFDLLTEPPLPLKQSVTTQRSWPTTAAAAAEQGREATYPGAAG